VISVNTTEVLLPVTVRDSSPVSGLMRNDFKVFEDGVGQALSDLSLRQVPVDVLLMVDASSVPPWYSPTSGNVTVILGR